MTTAELEVMALALAKLAFCAGLAGAIAMHLVMWTVARVVLAIGRWNDRRQRIHLARVRAHG